MVQSTKIAATSAVVSSLLIMFLFGRANAQAVANPNGSFESSAVTVGDDTSGIDGWSFELGGDANANFTIVDDTVQHGNFALKIAVNALGSNDWDIQVVNEPFFVEPNVQFQMSVWARTDSTPEATANFTVGNPAFGEFGRMGGAEVTNTWQEYTLNFTPGAGNDTGRVPIHFNMSGNEGVTFYVDNVRITRPYNNPNGGFEASAATPGEDQSVTQGWQFYEDAGEALYEIVSDTTHSGSRALAVTVNTAGSNPWDLQVVNEPFPVTPGESYTYSVWARTKDSDGGTAHFTVGDPSFSEQFRTEVTEGLTTEWQEITGSFTIDESDTSVARAPIHVSFDENVGETVYFDDLRIQRIQPPTDIPIIVEAELPDSIGSEWDTLSTDGMTYITTTTDYNETTGSADYPGENRTATYEVTFPDVGTYDLFVRLYVGANTFDDDSWFYGNGFGEQDPATTDGWILMNGMASAGFTGPNSVVREAGGSGSEVWKWVNVSRNAFQGDTSLTWTVDDESELTKTFVIGARENGLNFDKFAFGRSDLYFTVENLDSVTAGSDSDPEPPREAPIAEGKSKFLGNIYSSSQIQWFEYYWNQVTPENAGKWGSVEGTRDQMNWGSLDASYNLAQDNGFPFHFHVLVWGAQQPGWISNLDSTEQLAEIREWFEAVAARYPNIDYLEVVNEALPGHNPPNGNGDNANYINALGGSGETGYDWIITAFEMAAEIFPEETQLMINDYGIVSSAQSTADYLEIINLLIDRDLLDIIGVQAHTFSVANASASTIQQSLNDLAATGLPIQATEFDIAYANDQNQLQEYQEKFPIFWEHPDVEGMTLWGWRPGLWQNDANLVTEAGEHRPAMDWLINYVDTVTVGIHDPADGLPTAFKVYENYPNPFNPSTNIMFDVPSKTEITLNVYDLRGRLVKTLVNEVKEPGQYTVTFDVNNRFASGLYFYRLKAGDYTEVKRMMLIK
ncbi:MAG: endo-1,4-beta-xylanase [Candidatus Marinimicrobia bacterium]|nr:endo-1,4-beta-xylanase [Candidatus Neomarinimicrobiota bacterium]MCF7827621.1 endo-1,4-beta-xylanase [Candidatus Neomarinimicrobiota bacterium]MCF7881324.1 endo-1,4-beta-xylanase [Candidatus Neomarinimicrobiota bacterium]